MAATVGCSTVQDLPPAIADCGAEHALVGAVANLQTRFHEVMGVATIIDDCTVEISDFTFDGEGLSVHAVLGHDADFDSYDVLSDDLREDGPYDGVTLSLPLREGMSLDGVTHLSIWCIPASASFGDGPFELP